MIEDVHKWVNAQVDNCTNTCLYKWTIVQIYICAIAEVQKQAFVYMGKHKPVSVYIRAHKQGNKYSNKGSSQQMEEQANSQRQDWINKQASGQTHAL